MKTVSQHSYKMLLTADSPARLRHYYYFIYFMKGKFYIAVTMAPGAANVAVPIAFDHQSLAELVYKDKLEKIAAGSMNGVEVQDLKTYFKTINPILIKAPANEVMRMRKSDQCEVVPYNLMDDIRHWMLEIHPRFRDMIVYSIMDKINGIHSVNQ